MINLIDSVPHLHRAGVDVTIFTTDLGAPASAPAWRADVDDFPEGAASCDVRLFRAESPRRSAYAPELRKALRREISQFDLVRIHGLYLYPQYAAASEAQRADIPYIVTPHGALDPWLRRNGRVRKRMTDLAWQRRMLRDAAAIHATTEAESLLLDEVVPEGPSRRIVGNGVATKLFETLPARGAFRTSLGIDPDSALILFLGRMARKKAIDVLIRAVARLPDRSLALAIVGPDDEDLTAELRRLAATLGIDGLVHFAGPLYGSSRLQALADADLWILPSHTENFGNAVLEAMAASVPTVVSTQVNLAPDIVAARAGSVVRPDETALAGEIERLLDDPEERARIAAAGRAFADHYDWRHVAKQLASMYSEFARPCIPRRQPHRAQ